MLDIIISLDYQVYVYLYGGLLFMNKKINEWVVICCWIGWECFLLFCWYLQIVGNEIINIIYL